MIRQSAQLFGETAESSLSLETQLDAIRRWVASKPEVYRGVRPPIVEHAVSGAAPLRAGFDAMRAQAAPDVDFVIYKFDRLARDLLHQETIVRAVRLEGSAVVSISEPNSDLVRGIFGAVNEDFRRQLAERMRDVYRGRAARGVQGGRPPYGYGRAGVQVVARSDGTIHERPHGDFSVREDQAAVIREVFGRYDGGETRWSISVDLNRRGVATARGSAWTLDTVSGLLGRGLYAGRVAFGGAETGRVREEYRIVGGELYDRVQARLSREARTRGGKKGASWLDGLVEHGCGARMYAVWHADRQGTRFWCRSQTTAGGRCACPGRTVAAGKLEAAAFACLVRDLGGVRTLAEAVAWAEAEAGGAVARDRRGEIARALVRLGQRVERARSLYVEEGDDAARSAYVRVRDAAAVERLRLEGEAVALPAAPDAGRFTAMAAHLGEARALLPLLSDDGRRGLVEGLAVAVYDGRTVCWTWTGEASAFVPSPVSVAV